MSKSIENKKNLEKITKSFQVKEKNSDTSEYEQNWGTVVLQLAAHL